MRSLVLFCAFALVTVTAHAQPRRKAAPPPPPPPAATSTTIATFPAGTPPAPEVNTSGQPVADSPLLQRETEIRRGLHLEAFVDAQASLVNKNYYSGRGFTLNDAAIYLSKDFTHGVSAMIDLPFASVPASTGSNVAFGDARAQAYIQWLHEAFQAKFGQYDSIFGFEKNDSRDRFFADQGIVKTFTTPFTYVGALGGFSAGDFTGRVQLSNQREAGSMTDTNPELGLQARFDGQPLFGAIGLSINDQKGTDGSNMLIDLNVGVKMDQFWGAVYFDDRKIAGVDKHWDGFGAQGAFNMSPDLGLGARVEYVSDVVDNTIPYKSIFEISAGPSFQWLPGLTLRGDLDLASYSPVTGDSTTVFGAQASVVASF